MSGLDEFHAAFEAVLRTALEGAALYEALLRAQGLELPRQSAMHAAYRRKTRRRNRRRS